MMMMLMMMFIGCIKLLGTILVVIVGVREVLGAIIEVGKSIWVPRGQM